MIVVDTNVVSESLRLRCDEAVTAWLDAQAAESLYLTTINAAELWAGVALLPEGARKTALHAALDDVLGRLFAGRMLGFDEHAARAYANIARKTATAGTPLPLADGLIASIALSKGFAVATRDVAPFRAAGLEVINPWEFSS